MLRAGPFSDERVLRLAGRRFVPFYFDLATSGFAGDADARAFVVKVKPVLGGRGVPTPPVLLMTPDGKLLGEVSNYASADQVLRLMVDTLRKYPEYNKPAPDEKATADVLIDLQRYDAARKMLEGVSGDRARYVRGRLARWRGDWKTMEAEFAGVQDEALRDDVRMERAYRLWKEKKYTALERALAGFPKQSNRYTEARYYEGLALYHQDRKAKALTVWESTIKACSQDPWVYRADWAFCNAKQKGRRGMFSSAGPRTSCLNRIGYMGRRNPDLAP